MRGSGYFLEVPCTIAVTGKCLQNEKAHAERELNRVMVELLAKGKELEPC